MSDSFLQSLPDTDNIDPVPTVKLNKKSPVASPDAHCYALSLGQKAFQHSLLKVKGMNNGLESRSYFESLFGIRLS